MNFKTSTSEERKKKKKTEKKEETDTTTTHPIPFSALQNQSTALVLDLKQYFNVNRISGQKKHIANPANRIGKQLHARLLAREISGRGQV